MHARIYRFINCSLSCGGENHPTVFRQARRFCSLQTLIYFESPSYSFGAYLPLSRHSPSENDRGTCFTNWHKMRTGYPPPAVRTLPDGLAKGTPVGNGLLLRGLRRKRIRTLSATLRLCRGIASLDFQRPTSRRSPPRGTPGAGDPPREAPPQRSVGPGATFTVRWGKGAGQPPNAPECGQPPFAPSAPQRPRIAPHLNALSERKRLPLRGKQARSSAR